MNKFILILLIVLPAISSGRNNRQNKIKYSKIYTPGKKFYFNYSITKDNKKFKIVPVDWKNIKTGMSVKSRNDWEEYVFPETKDTVFTDTLMFSVSEYKIRKGKKYKPAGTVILFAAERFSRQFGHIDISSTKNYLKLIPFANQHNEVGFMQDMKASPPLMITAIPEQDSVWSDTSIVYNYRFSEAVTKYYDSLEVVSTYQILGRQIVNSVIGKIETWQIKSSSRSLAGSSQLNLNFSSEYGFVTIDFQLLNGARLKLELIGVEEYVR